MHSILAFSASHLAWISQSNETRNLAFHHASIALKGLHDGITNFTKLNSDATDWYELLFYDTCPHVDQFCLGAVGVL